MCYYYGGEVDRNAIITADVEIIRYIGTALLTQVGGIVAISTVGRGGLYWRRWETTTGASLEVH